MALEAQRTILAGYHAERPENHHNQVGFPERTAQPICDRSDLENTL
jgi:hypothetical protein